MNQIWRFRVIAFLLFRDHYGGRKKKILPLPSRGFTLDNRFILALVISWSGEPLFTQTCSGLDDEWYDYYIQKSRGGALEHPPHSPQPPFPCSLLLVHTNPWPQHGVFCPVSSMRSEPEPESIKSVLTLVFHNKMEWLAIIAQFISFVWIRYLCCGYTMF